MFTLIDFGPSETSLVLRSQFDAATGDDDLFERRSNLNMKLRKARNDMPAEVMQQKKQEEA